MILTLTKRDGVVKSSEWIFVMSFASWCFWEIDRGVMCSTSYIGILNVYYSAEIGRKGEDVIEKITLSGRVGVMDLTVVPGRWK